MKGLVCSFVFVVVAVIGSQATDKFIYEDCSKKDSSIGRVSKIELPSPISLSDFVTATAELTLDQDVPDGAYIKTNFYKVKYLFGVPINVPIPCIRGYGSCTTKHCDFLKDAFEVICPFFPEGHDCNCPIKAGTYRGQNVVVGKPQVGPIASFLAKGHFRYEFRILSPDKKKELFCAIFTGKLAA